MNYTSHTCPKNMCMICLTETLIPITWYGLSEKISTSINLKVECTKCKKQYVYLYEVNDDFMLI